MKQISSYSWAIALILLLGLAVDLPACTSFRLATDSGLYYVHSLNQGNVASVPGRAFINPRGQYKYGYSWADLTRVGSESGPALIWQSTYGSVTFNPFGKELPDGGMNEAGLFIWEMSFDTEYPQDSLCPTLFQGQWMQYLLDNYATVNQVLQDINRINLDGWGWHYFVADSTGATAIIDFVAGSPRVYTGETMPVPLCCNSNYPEAITWLSQYEGFGGQLPVRKQQEEIPRFIYGARLLQDFSKQNPVDYSFFVLDEMSSNVRWSIVYDQARSRVYFSTNVNREMRFFSFSNEDFDSTATPLSIDINGPGSGNVRDLLSPYRPDENVQLLTRLFATICSAEPYFRKSLLDDQNTDLPRLVAAVSRRIDRADGTAHVLTGHWNGTIGFGEAAQSVHLELTHESGRLQGAITIGENAEPDSLSNIRVNGGLLSFTVQRSKPAELQLYQLFLGENSLRGSQAFIDHTGRNPVVMPREN